jgi:hypothetical protein
MNGLVLANKAGEWHRLKALVLDSACPPITKRVYNLGLEVLRLVRPGATAGVHEGGRGPRALP